ncbi:hypothetical protein SAMN05216412_101278 [Nitrosospira multiformis]|uniref:Uncharacterized protein n=1 Tax=Nitrosospira multiformis TaxID=1231 RepID=A0A1H9YKV4_9PROT|nr:hypothetical protein SAMN05216412_101278 [Nitrosospira multiformis]
MTRPCAPSFHGDLSVKGFEEAIRTDVMSDHLRSRAEVAEKGAEGHRRRFPDGEGMLLYSPVTLLEPVESRRQEMSMPGFTAGDALPRTTVQYHSITSPIGSTSRQAITPQQGATSVSRSFFRCSRCVRGQQFCCPPPGVGAPCYIRRCRSRYDTYQGG